MRPRHHHHHGRTDQQHGSEHNINKHDNNAIVQHDNSAIHQYHHPTRSDVIDDKPDFNDFTVAFTDDDTLAPVYIYDANKSTFIYGSSDGPDKLNPYLRAAYNRLAAILTGTDSADA